MVTLAPHEMEEDLAITLLLVQWYSSDALMTLTLSDQSSESVRLMEAGVGLNLFASLLTVSIYIGQIQAY